MVAFCFVLRGHLIGGTLPKVKSNCFSLHDVSGFWWPVSPSSVKGASFVLLTLAIYLMEFRKKDVHTER